MSKKKMIPESDWKWFGFANHFICGMWCRFHMATQVGYFIVSTVGMFVHPMHGKGNEMDEAKWIAKNPNGGQIGSGRTYETMVFRAGKPCAEKGCGCGQPIIDGSELDFNGYNDANAATIGHRMMCLKVAIGNVKVREVDES